MNISSWPQWTVRSTCSWTAFLVCTGAQQPSFLAPHHILPHTEAPVRQAILKTLAVAATQYTRKNMRILYDALSTLADVQRAKLVPHLPTIMPPLLQRWHLLHDADRELLPLLECLTSLAQALGAGLPAVLRASNKPATAAEQLEHAERTCPIWLCVLWPHHHQAVLPAAHWCAEALSSPCSRSPAWVKAASPSQHFSPVGASSQPACTPLTVPAYNLSTSWLSTPSPAGFQRWHMLCDNTATARSTGHNPAAFTGPAFESFSSPAFERCERILSAHIAPSIPNGSAPSLESDKDFVIGALDMVSGLAEGLGQGLQPLIARSQLRNILLRCCQVPAPQQPERGPAACLSAADGAWCCWVCGLRSVQHGCTDICSHSGCPAMQQPGSSWQCLCVCQSLPSACCVLGRHRHPLPVLPRGCHNQSVPSGPAGSPE